MLGPRAPVVIALLLVAAPALAGCIGDEDSPVTETGADAPVDASSAPSWAKALPDEVTGLEHRTTLGPDDGMDSGYQLVVEGETAYVAAWNAGFYTVNLSDPEEPQVLGHLAEHFGHDVRVLHYDDGRTFAAVAGSDAGIAMVNVTDPTRPELVSTILGEDGSTDTEGANVHNIALVPGTHLIYNSRSVDTPGVDIVDASDPANPELVRVFNDVTCHDVTFHMPAEQAFCAGIRETQIWDIGDPEQPTIVSRIYNPSINIHHWAVPAENGSVLVIGDEFLGAAVPAANACGPSATNPATGATTTHPIGALWFYDISDPAAPTPLSYVGASQFHQAAEPCTAHFGEVLPDRSKMVVGFLSGGVYTVDFADLESPRVIDHLDIGEVVEVDVHHGYAFGVGRGRGLDVYGFAAG